MPPKRKKIKTVPKSDDDNDDEQQQSSTISTENNDDNNDDEKMMKPFNLKIISWNVNGIRAALKNGCLKFFESESCDILAIQETKCNDKTFPLELKQWPKFPYKYYVSSKQDGYAGVALFSKQKPLSVEYGIGKREFDDEGRIITAYYDNFILVNAYVVNAGQGLKRLDFKLQFDQDFQIDLENPKTNTKTAGFTPEERTDFDHLLNSGFIDSFRLLYPNQRKCYTYWGYRFNCRTKDIGWRLDYFLLSKHIVNQIIIIMSSSTTVSNPVPPPQPPPPSANVTTQQTTVTKNDLKQIGICLPTNTPMEIATNTANTSTGQSSSSSSLNLSYSNAAKNVVTNNTNNFYTTATTAGQFQMGSLSVMVAKLNPSTRQQTVILQPRINTTRGTTLQIQNSVRNSTGNSLPNSQTISTTFPSSNSSAISVRTRVISGQGNHPSTTIPLLNLSTVAAASSAVATSGGPPNNNTTSNVTTNSVKQMITGQKFITAGSVETVNLMISNPNEVRNLKTNAQNSEIKSLYKINGPKQLTGSSTATAALVTAQTTPKMISINNASGHQSCQATATRFGILSSNANAKSAVINLPKNFIITPTGASGITNMVSISSANFPANRIPLSRQQHHTVTTLSAIHSSNSSTLPSSSTTTITTTNMTTKSTPTTIYTVNTANQNATNVLNNSNIITTLQPIMTNHQQQSNNNHQTSNIISSSNTTSSIAIANINNNNTTATKQAMNIQTINNSNNLSPIKSTATNLSFPIQHHHQSITTTPSSPRPRILSRKRTINDLPTSITIKSNNNNNNLHNTNGSIAFITSSSSSSNVNHHSTITTTTTNQQHLPTIITNDKSLINQKQLCLKETDYKDLYEQQQQQQQTKISIKKPRLSIINYHTNGKLPQFSSYNDVKPKNDKKLTLQDLLNDVRKQNEWKDFILTDQCKKLADDEESFTQKRLELLLTKLENEISPFSKCAAMTTLYDEIDNNNQSQQQSQQQQQQRTSTKINIIDRKCVRINDIIRANIQRSKVLCEHFIDCNQIIQRLTYEHKDKVTNLSKRLNCNINNNNSSNNNNHNHKRTSSNSLNSGYSK
ncbi:DNA-(apurinic or apyrimidinic site) lyase [Dermatophagoides pteronyssinus]|uniref:exodeoxyribonuclease III n=1 Tax=Dermatophagoides pteronyssinus TaxID=6956 RepID=A0ABQ8J3W6_DERPT|nr:DNA-(apurinic or apyrimidinic site) lyase [Dermatophagoides pteronyssinus]